MNNGLQFGMEGPNMQGTWMNPATGHKFTVRDCYFENNQFMVQTTDGQILDYNTIQDYVQCKDGEGKEMDFLPPDAITPIPDSIKELIVPEYEDTPVTPTYLTSTTPNNLGNLHKSPDPVPSNDPDAIMVQRVLHKHAKPEINAAIVWQAPLRQIDTLMNILGVEASVIADYYMQFLDKAAVMEAIRRNLIDYIETTGTEPQSTGFMTPVVEMPTVTYESINTTASLEPSQSELQGMIQKARPVGGAKKVSPTKKTPVTKKTPAKSNKRQKSK